MCSLPVTVGRRCGGRPRVPHLVCTKGGAYAGESSGCAAASLTCVNGVSDSFSRGVPPPKWAMAIVDGLFPARADQNASLRRDEARMAMVLLPGNMKLPEGHHDAATD